MRNIKSITLTYLHTDEALGFLESVQGYASLIGSSSATEGIQVFTQVLSDFQSVYNPDAKNTYTKSRREADREVDSICSGLKLYVRGMTSFPDGSVRLIAERVKRIIDKSGHLSAMGYSKKYPNIYILLGRLRDIDPTELAMIHLDEWVDGLQVAYDKFMAVSHEQTLEDAKRGVGTIQAKRKRAQQGYYDFVRLVNALVVVSGESDLGAFIDTVNTLIDEYKVIIASRKTRANTEDNS